jgi:hypothetical protein
MTAPQVNEKARILHYCYVRPMLFLASLARLARKTLPLAPRSHKQSRDLSLDR